MLAISPGRSDFLNFVRWASAGLVLVGHAEMISQMLLGAGVDRSNAVFTYLSAHAHIAVMFFFVLSGYLIGYAVHRNEERAAGYGFKAYFLDRWSRIYSVLIAAILLTLVLDSIGGMFSANYRLAQHIPQDGFAVRLLINLFSLQGLLGHRVQFGSNPALWSIGYEFCYYMVFGLIYFRPWLFRRPAVFAAVLVAIALLAGLHMTAYFAIWLLGYGAFRLHHVQGFKLDRRLILPLAVAIAIANHYLAFHNLFQVPAFFADVIIALLFAAMLLCDMSGAKSAFSAINAYLADFSYSIYAYHMPIIYFWYSMTPQTLGSSLTAVQSGLMVSLVCLLAARLLYHVSESRRSWYRAMAARVLERARALTAR
jgi:peptidoglycan/LPS O-acetylase OafA/YrhL